MQHPIHHARVTPEKIAYRMADGGPALTFAGLDERANRRQQLRIHSADSGPSVWVIPTDEEQIIARCTLKSLN